MAQKAQALKELELEKKKYEELQSKLEKEKLDLSRQDARIREERQKVDQGKKGRLSNGDKYFSKNEENSTKIDKLTSVSLKFSDTLKNLLSRQSAASMLLA